MAAEPPAPEPAAPAPPAPAPPAPPRYAGVQGLLEAARSGLDRLTPEQAATALADGSLMVDIRPAWQRAAQGEVPGALVVERNHLEWRLDPNSDARLPPAVPGQHWVVICSEGYTSSLAAASLLSIGVPACDVIGGIQQWRADGLPMVAGPTRTERVCGSEPLPDLGDLGGPHVEDVAAD
jgi:rhodanese-related sulfurtransferase